MSEQTSETVEVAPEDVQEILDAEGALSESIDALAAEVPDEALDPYIEGTAWVTVQLKLNNFAGSPEDAAEAAMLDFITFGLHDRVVLVHDPATERDYAVSQGGVLTQEELDELLRG